MDMMSRNTNTKLADVLKRSGLAASINDAKRIAGDISSTEKKVQSYFDKKKNEMKDDLARKSQNIYVEKPEEKIQEIKSEPITEEHIEQTDIKQELKEVSKEVKKHLEEASSSNLEENDVISKVENHNPAQQEDLKSAEEKEGDPHSLKQMFEDENTGREFIYSHMDEFGNNQVPNTEQETLNNHSETIMKPIETIKKPNETIEEINNTNTNETIEKPLETKMEVISEEPIKPDLQENKMEIIEETPIKEPQQNNIEESSSSKTKNVIEEASSSKTDIVNEEKTEEPKIDLTQMFNFGSNNKMQQPKEQPQQVEQKVEVKSEPIQKTNELGITTSSESDHPKTGNSESIDINEMFNFAKRGKI